MSLTAGLLPGLPGILVARRLRATSAGAFALGGGSIGAVAVAAVLHRAPGVLDLATAGLGLAFLGRGRPQRPQRLGRPRMGGPRRPADRAGVLPRTGPAGAPG